jgi:hypothetical protein
VLGVDDDAWKGSSEEMRDGIVVSLNAIEWSAHGVCMDSVKLLIKFKKPK